MAHEVKATLTEALAKVKRECVHIGVLDNQGTRQQLHRATNGQFIASEVIEIPAVRSFFGFKPAERSVTINRCASKSVRMHKEVLQLDASANVYVCAHYVAFVSLMEHSETLVEVSVDILPLTN